MNYDTSRLINIKEMIMLKIRKEFGLLLSLAFATVTFADTTVTMNETAPGNTVGKNVGTVTITETKYGLMFTPNLNGASSGIHGFHVHAGADCGNNGDAAGGHLDPKKTGKHLGPYNDNGHLGDLPALYILTDGTASLPVVAPRLKHISEIKNHVLMIHKGPDNYSDTPQPLGGGDGRMICGIIK